MKIIEQSAQLIWVTPSPEKIIERAGRVAYKSEDKITDTSHVDFIRKIIKAGHEAVIEHACASMQFVCDRGISHEIVRHRIASYTQESSRYCNYSKDKFGNEITVIVPPEFNGGYAMMWADGTIRHFNSDWYQATKGAEKSYMNLLANGFAPQIARSVLPTCLKTEIVMTTNFREWRHFLKLRIAPDAHPQMRELARMALDILKKEAPIVFEDLEA